MNEPNKKPSDFWLLLHSLVVLCGLGGFLAWSFLVPLEEGVTTSGQIIVEQNRKTLQHLEGGIVRAIYVEEGDYVESGDVLFELDTIAITSNRDQIALDRATFLGNAERIEALMNNEDSLNFETAESWGISDKDSQSIQSEQLKVFREQKENYTASISVYNQRIQSLQVGEEKRSALIASTEDSIRTLDQELDLKRKLVDEQLATVEEVYRLEREKSRLVSELANLEKQILEVSSQIDEVRRERTQTTSAFREELSRELAQTRTEISKAEEQLKAIDDAVFRSKVVAPDTGQVMNLKFATIGGVVQPGEPMLEIVPASSGMWAALQILPNDRDSISTGMDVRVTLAGFKSWKTPDIGGKVMFVSPDLKTIQETGMSYYEARILLDQDDLKSSKLPPILPGMPVQAFVEAGSARTLAEYLIEPIYEHLKKGLSSG